MRLHGLLAMAAWTLAFEAGAQSVGPALARPAVMVRHAEHTTLLGAAAAGPRLVAVGERGIVVVSDDSGATWRQVATPVSVTLTAVRFPDAMHGFAVGHGGVVLVTSDGGSTWDKHLDGIQAAALVLAAAQRDGDPKAVRDAERLVADGPDKPLLDLHFDDARHGLVIGAYNLAFTTADGGSSWQPVTTRLDNPKGLHLYSVRARGETIVIAGEQGLVLRSDDHGLSFRRLTTPYRGSFFTVELPTADGRAMVLAGLRGNVWRSEDRGETWSQWAVPTQASITASALTADGSAIVFVDQAGQTLRVGRDGRTVADGAPSPPLTGVYPLRDGRLLQLSVVGASVKPAPQR